MVRLLHLCDSLFPIGGFAYSDGLEAAADWGQTPIGTVLSLGVRPQLARDGGPGAPERAGEWSARDGGLREWLDVCLDETIGRLEGPAVSRAWTAFMDADWAAVAHIDAELTALRPSSSVRRSSRAMGLRLLSTWQALHPHARAEHALALARQGVLGPTLPVAFAGACVSIGVDRHLAVEGYAYTRLAATISAAMRLMPIGQTAAHAELARVLDRVRDVVNAMATGPAELQCFTPVMDIAAMTQQYLHSRLFRS
jgi:urease accessory protein